MSTKPDAPTRGWKNGQKTINGHGYRIEYHSEFGGFNTWWTLHSVPRKWKSTGIFWTRKEVCNFAYKHAEQGGWPEGDG